MKLYKIHSPSDHVQLGFHIQLQYYTYLHAIDFGFVNEYDFVMLIKQDRVDEL